MTFLEALEKAQKDDKWFRPLPFGGTGAAYEARENVVYAVPSMRGGRHAFCPYINELLGDWEVVDPDVVNRE